MGDRLLPLPLTERTVHLCVDMQRIFFVSGSETDVCVLERVLDAVDIGYRVIVVRDDVCTTC